VASRKRPARGFFACIKGVDEGSALEASAHALRRFYAGFAKYNSIKFNNYTV